MNPYITRLAGVESLRECRERIAAMPDRCREPDIECPLCGEAIDVRKSRHHPRFVVAHPREGECRFANRAWHIASADRAEAIATWPRTAQ